MIFGVSKYDISLLQNAITYFDALGNILFKEQSHKLNWYKVFTNLIKENIFDTKCDEYKELYSFKDMKEDTDIFQKACYKYFEFINNNEYEKNKLYKLFDMPENIYNFFQSKEESVNRTRDYIRFNSFKCYSCKHFKEHIRCIDNTSLDLDIEFIRSNITKDNKIIKNMYYIIKRMDCDKRQELINELMASDTYPYDKERRINNALEKSFAPRSFLFKEKENGELNNSWELSPIAIDDRCQYYEKDDEMTSEKFVEKYLDI